MNNQKRRLKAIYLCAMAALCLLAFTAVSAQASEAFWIEGEAIATPAEIKSEVDEPFTLTTSGISISCENTTLNGSLGLNGVITGQLSFLSCKETGGCTISNFSASIKISLSLHSSNIYGQLIPGFGSTFATIPRSGEGCKSLKPTITVLMLEDSGGGFGSEAVSHLVKMYSGSLFELLTKENQMTLTGSLNLSLKGINEGKKWKGSFATPEANFKIGGSNLTETTEVEWEQDKALTWLFSTPFSFEITCEETEVEDGLLLVEGKGLAKFYFRNCKTFTTSGLKEIKTCVPENFSTKLKSTLFRHKGNTYVLLEPITGITFAVIEFPEGLCALAEVIELNGSLVLEDASGTFEKEAEAHLLQPASTELFQCSGVKFGLNPVKIDGSLSVKLSGKNKGKSWSALAS
jgi:hypothetical protein